MAFIKFNQGIQFSLIEEWIYQFLQSALYVLIPNAR